MSVTMKDIAREVGVSQMTVSRALRGVTRISPNTRRLVRDAAQRLGYQPINSVIVSPTVRSGNGNHTLRILLPTVSRRVGAEAGSWYLDRMIGAMHERLKLSNGRLVEQHFPDIDSLLAEWERGRYHGVILRQPLPHRWVERLLEQGPVVYAVEFDHQLDVDCVYSNEHRSASMVLDHLTQRGHQHIAWLGLLDRHSPYQVVFDALDESSVVDRLAISVHGGRHAAWANLVYCQGDRPQSPLILVERDWRTQGLELCVERGLERILALDPLPSAIVCSCDPVALALLNALKDRGLRVPEDVSVVSYGGSPQTKTAQPALTGVEMPMETIGRVVPELIERRLADPAAAPISMQFQTTLFEGGSVSRRGKEDTQIEFVNQP